MAEIPPKPSVPDGSGPVEPVRSAELVELMAQVERAYENMGRLQVSPRLSEAVIDARIAERFDFSAPTGLKETIRASAELLRDGLTQVAHPRYYGFFNPSVSLSSVCADALASVYNPQLAVWAHAPAAVQLEQHVLEYLARKMGFAAETTKGSHFTTGGTEANHTSVLAALNQRWPDYAERGLLSIGARPRIYVSDQGHESFEKVCQMSGLSRRAVLRIDSDDGFGLDVDRLEEAIHTDRRNGWTPLMVVATAGSTTVGAIDPLGAIAELAERHGLWTHVDAAWGGAAMMSKRLAGSLHGIERADSVTIDAHKWFSVSMGAGMFFCRHPEALSRAFGIATSYMPDSAGARREPYSSTMQWSRRFIGLKLAMTLAEIGEQGMAGRIDHQADMGDRLRRLLLEAGFEIVFRSPLPLVCFTHPLLRVSGRAPRDRCAELVAGIQGAGHWVAAVEVRGEPFIRACVTSFRTQASDIDALVEAISAALPSSVG